MPELFIITGSNGAGKSSIGPEYLPDYIRSQGPVFDGDKLFVEKRNELWRARKSPKECNKLAYQFVTETFDQQVDNALSNKLNYAYEGHFTNEATWNIPRLFKKAGYAIHLVFLGLQDISLSRLRVLDRTKIGGHYVDPGTIADNFNGNLEKLNQHFEIFDTVQIIDTSETEHIALVELAGGQPSNAIPSTMLPEWFKEHLPVIMQIILDDEPRIFCTFSEI